MLLATLLWTPLGARAGEAGTPPAVDAELAYLLDFVGPHRRPPGAFDPRSIAATLDFVDSSKADEVLYAASPRKGAPSAYYETDIRRPLADILRLSYEPRIPAAALAPSTVRTARWVSIEPAPAALAALWNPASLPPAITGVEHVVNSPDEHSGAYYEYDLDRTLLMLPRVGGRRLFISLSAQRGESSVGKLGLVVGSDRDWTYLYTGQPGLNWPGMGSVRSYMYDSYSAAFYLESPARPGTRFAVFKWVRAGWAGINMVRSEHIHAGLRRFGESFRAILEHPAARDAKALEERFAAIRTLPEQELRRLVRSYLETLRAEVRGASLLSEERKAEPLLAGSGYQDGLARDEMEAIVAVEQVKALLGKPVVLEAGQTNAGSNRGR